MCILLDVDQKTRLTNGWFNADISIKMPMWRYCDALRDISWVNIVVRHWLKDFVKTKLRYIMHHQRPDFYDGTANLSRFHIETCSNKAWQGQIIKINRQTQCARWILRKNPWLSRRASTNVAEDNAVVFQGECPDFFDGTSNQLSSFRFYSLSFYIKPCNNRTWQEYIIIINRQAQYARWILREIHGYPGKSLSRLMRTVTTAMTFEDKKALDLHEEGFQLPVTPQCCEKIPWHDDVIKWKHFPRYWPFVRGIRRSPVNFPHKGQWRGALMF